MVEISANKVIIFHFSACNSLLWQFTGGLLLGHQTRFHPQQVCLNRQHIQAIGIFSNPALANLAVMKHALYVEKACSTFAHTLAFIFSTRTNGSNLASLDVNSLVCILVFMAYPKIVISRHNMLMILVV